MSGQKIGEPVSSKQDKPKWLVLAIIIAGAIVAAILWSMFAQGPVAPAEEPLESELPMQELNASVSPQGAAETDAKTEALLQVGSSTEIADIEKDLRETDLTGLDAEMAAIDSEIGQ